MSELSARNRAIVARLLPRIIDAQFMTISDVALDDLMGAARSEGMEGDAEDQRARALIREAAKLIESRPTKDYAGALATAMTEARRIVSEGLLDWQDFATDRYGRGEITDYNGHTVAIQHWMLADIVAAMDAGRSPSSGAGVSGEEVRRLKDLAGGICIEWPTDAWGQGGAPEVRGLSALIEALDALLPNAEGDAR